MAPIALIPARGGSKGIPRKNVLLVGGQPLIAWTIAAALAAPGVSRVLVSTDDPEIAAVARAHGAEVPFLRPAALATDSASSLEVALHALDWLEKEELITPEYLLLLQPTSPLRRSTDIVAAMQLAATQDADAVLGVCEAAPHPYLARTVSSEGVISDFLPISPKPATRQEYPPAYVINGALYLIRSATLRAERTFQPPGALACIMPVERSLDIDTPWEMRLVDLLLRENGD